MEARILKVAILAAALASLGASYRTRNFIVTTGSQADAERIGREAERYRRELAIEWLGKEMPSWSQPCPISAQVAEDLGAGGQTSFLFERGEVFGWRMSIQGSRERLLDSVLPHEVTHTIFATHFRQALPRWADEGACTTVEHASERAKQQMMLVDFLRTGRGIPFNRMFAMTDYPHDIMPLYSQGYSLARYLIAQGGHRKFIEYLGDGMSDDNWTRATQRHYGFSSIGNLQTTWNQWVAQGSPAISAPAIAAASTLASAQQRPRPKSDLIYRAQSADPQPAAATETAAATGAYGVEPAATSAEDEAPAATQQQTSNEASSRAPTQTSAAATGRIAPPAVDGPEELTDLSQKHQVTRPEGKSRQVILEWSRSDAPDRRLSHAADSANRTSLN